MAKGTSVCRRKGSSLPKLLRSESKCSSHSAKALTDGNGNHHLDQSIKQALQRRGGKQVKAFVIMALHDDGDISTHTTDHVQQCTDSIFASDAGDCLRYAHRSSVRNAPSCNDSEDQDLISPPTFNDRNASGAVYRKGTKPLAAKQPATVPSPCIANEIDANVETKEETPSSENRPGLLQSFQICESSKIEAFLGKRLRTLQQLAVKRIAKAWIKGICPKKQATFPYHKKKREREGLDHYNDFSGYIPGWWPDTSVCRYVEPDHIKRDERINLCLHLLRLRPTPSQLKEWNKGSMPHQTHVTKGWTEFLQELAPPSIFDEMREPDDKTEERSRLLAQIYELAKREEGYFNGDIDGDARYWWHTEVADRKPAPRKTGRRSYDSSVDESDAESAAESAPPLKRSKKASAATSPSHSPVTAQFEHIDVNDRMQDCKPVVIEEQPEFPRSFAEAYPPSTSSDSPQGPWSHEPAPDSKPVSMQSSMPEQPQIVSNAHGLPQGYNAGNPWIANSSQAPYSTATTSSMQAMSQAFVMGVPTSTFPGRHDYSFPRQSLGQPGTTIDQGCPAYMAPDVPQPHFDTVSSMYTPQAPVHSPHVTAGEQPQLYSNFIYYGQPANAQSPFVTVPGTLTTNHQLNTSAPPDMSFRPCTPGPAQCFAVNPTHYQYPPHTSYQYSHLHHGDDFQAPARVERGFTGHGSGVGGGAHT